MTTRAVSNGECIRIIGEMTIYTASELYGEVIEALGRAPAPRRLDLSAVTEMDCAGLQILLMLQRCARAAGSEPQWADASPAVAAVLELLRLPPMPRARSNEVQA